MGQDAGMTTPNTIDDNEDEIEREMAKLAQTSNDFHIKRTLEMKEQNKGRSTASSTTSFSSNGAFSVDKRSPQITAVLNGVLDTFNGLFVQRANVARYDIQFKVPASEEPEEVIHNTFKEIFAKLITADKRTVIYPWVSKDAIGREPNEKTITAVKQFPKD